MRFGTMAFALSSYLGHNALPHTQQLVDLHELHLGKREGGGRNTDDHDRVDVHVVDLSSSSCQPQEQKIAMA